MGEGNRNKVFFLSFFGQIFLQLCKNPSLPPFPKGRGPNIPLWEEPPGT